VKIIAAATGAYVKPTSRVSSADSAGQDTSASLFVKSAYVHQVVMDHVISLVNVSVMKAMLASSATAVQTTFMGFLTAELVTATPSGHSVVSATTQLETATAGQTSGVVIATAVTKAWWASPRVLSATATQMARVSYLVRPTTYATARLSISACVNPTWSVGHVIVACTVSTTSAAAILWAVHPAAARHVALCQEHETVTRKVGDATARIT